jgi:hypothetical protein
MNEERHITRRYTDPNWVIYRRYPLLLPESSDWFACSKHPDLKNGTRRKSFHAFVTIGSSMPMSLGPSPLPIQASTSQQAFSWILRKPIHFPSGD